MYGPDMQRRLFQLPTCFSTTYPHVEILLVSAGVLQPAWSTLSSGPPVR